MRTSDTKKEWYKKRIRETHERQIDRFLKKIEDEKKKKEERRRERVRRGNKSAYAKIRAKNLEYHKSIGDDNKNYNVILTKNRKDIDHPFKSKWKVQSYKYFSDVKETNKVLFPRQYERKNNGEVIPVTYEMLLVEHIDPKYDTTKSMLRNEYGKFIEHEVVGRDVQIIDKFKFNVEEDFYVYGYHPIKDRKDCRFIIDNILLKVPDKFAIKRVYIFANKLIVKCDAKIDIIVCRNHKDARRLYNTLLKECSEGHYVFFNYSPLEWESPIMDEVRELTGWNKNMLYYANW